MIRKLFMVAAVAVIPVAAIVATGSQAGAVAPVTSTATCAAVSGTVHFSTPISNAGVPVLPGHSFTETTTVTATLTHCTSNDVGLVINHGAVAGTVALTTHNTGTTTIKAATCAGLAGVHTVVGHLATTWTANRVTPATHANATQETGGLTGTPAHGTFKLGPVGDLADNPGSSFQGANTGKTSTSIAETVLTTAQILAACAHPVSSLAITTDTAHPVVPAATFS